MFGGARRCGLAAKPLFGACLMLVLAQDLARSSSPSLEYAIKAAYLYKFAPFVVWPASAFASSDGPLTICVSGRDPFGKALDQVTAGQRVAGRAIVVRRIADIAADSGCQIAYIGGSPTQSIARALEAVRGQPVLTVTDDDPDRPNHGIITLEVVQNRVRFKIDEREAEQCRLAISSKLLNLALRPPKAN